MYNLYLPKASTVGYVQFKNYSSERSWSRSLTRYNILRKYIFFDFETTGKGKVDPGSKRFGSKWEQILQVGAILVDENLQQTNYTLD